MHVEVCFVLMVDVVGLGSVVIFKSPGGFVVYVMQCKEYFLCFFFFVFAFVILFHQSATRVFCWGQDARLT